MTDWKDPDNRVLLYNAMLAKLKILVGNRPEKGQWPESWALFLKDHGIGSWGFESLYGVEDLHYACPDHVWIHSPDGEVADDLGEEWDYRRIRSVLLIPPEFAEKAVKSLIMGWIAEL